MLAILGAAARANEVVALTAGVTAARTELAPGKRRAVPPTPFNAAVCLVAYGRLVSVDFCKLRALLLPKSPLRAFRFFLTGSA